MHYLQQIVNGFLKANRVKKIVQEETGFLKHIYERGLRSIQLQITQDCNFKCRYCSYSFDNNVDRIHKHINMSWKIAKKSIDFLFDHSKDAENILISFYGGEPFLNFEVLKQSVEYAENLFQAKKVSFNLTTNCTILTGEILDFIIKHRIFIMISLDGPQNIHDKHRVFRNSGKGTFQTVWKNVQKIREKDLNYFKSNVQFNSVMLFGEDKSVVEDFFSKNDIFPYAVHIGYADDSGMDYEYDYNLEFFQKSYEEQTKVLVATANKEYDSVLSKKENIPERYHPRGICVPGATRLLINVRGEFFPCEKVLESEAVNIGNLSEGFNIKKAKKLFNLCQFVEEECKNCWAIRFCGICAIHCVDVDKNVISKDVICNNCIKKRKSIEIYIKNKLSERNFSNE